jgi:hypothetical protein
MHWHPTQSAGTRAGVPRVPWQAQHRKLPWRLIQLIYWAGRTLRQLLKAVAVWAARQGHHRPMERWMLPNTRPSRQELYSGQRITCSELSGGGDLRVGGTA